MRTSLPALAAICILASGLAVGSPVEDLHKLFPNEATITAPSAGLCRLELGAEVLAGCRPDLADLRIFDASGREVPYVVDTGVSQGMVVVHEVDAEVLDASRREERRDDGPPRFVESYTLALPDVPQGAGGWELVFTSDRREFVRRIDLEVQGGDGRWRAALEGGSAFRLLTPPATRLRFPLGVGDARVVRVRLVGEGDDFLRPGFRYRATRSIGALPPAVVDLAVVGVSHPARQTVVELERPRGLVPAALRLLTTTGAFHREVTVWDHGPGSAATPLGREVLFRIASFAEVDRMEIGLQPAGGDRLRVAISDLDSPPLENLRFAAVVPRPALLFWLPEDTREAVLTFGGGRAGRPDYDLGAFLRGRGLPLGDEAAQQVIALRTSAQKNPATLGAVRPNPSYDPSPALAFAMHPGAALGVRPYSHRRVLHVIPSDEGLASLRLAPEDLAVARHDLADLRVVDDEARQWAYLVNRRAGSETLALDILSVRQADGRSHYRFELPVEELSIDRLEIDPVAEFFDRAFELEGAVRDGSKVRLARGRLVRRQDDPRPLALDIAGQRLRSLELIVDDGNDAPLVLASVTATAPLPTLFLVAPEGDYTLLLGVPKGRAPRYELERVRSTVLAVPSAAIEAGALEANPDFRASARLARGGGAQQIALWVVIVLAVLALGGLSLRLARQKPLE